MRVNHYSRLGVIGKNSVPRLLFEIKIDLQDVRSAYRYSDNFLLLADWLTSEDSVWTPDMVERIVLDQLEVIEAPEPCALPENLEGKMLAFLIRHLRFEVWRNEYLKMYSNPGESRADFLGRCRDLLVEERTREIRRLRELWLHRFSELEKKTRQYLEDEEMDARLRVDLLIRTREVFRGIREDLGRTFAEEVRMPVEIGDLKWDLSFCPDVHDRLQDLGRDIVLGYNDVCGQFDRLALEIENYEVAPGRSDLDVLVKGIVWSRWN